MGTGACLWLGFPVAEAQSPGTGHVAGLLVVRGRPCGQQGLGRPGMAVSLRGQLAPSGERETQASEARGIILGLAMAAGLGVTVSSWGPLQTSLSTYYVPEIVVAAGPSEQGHILQS